MSEKPPSSLKSWLVKAVIGLVAVTVCVWGINQVGKVALRPEHELQAMLLTFAVVEDYLKANNGAWPRSWKDLETLPPRSRGMYTWPEDSERIQEYVAIDFAADPAKLARESPEKFAAIYPIFGYYSYNYKDDRELGSLLKTLSESVVESENATNRRTERER